MPQEANNNLSAIPGAVWRLPTVSGTQPLNVFIGPPVLVVSTVLYRGIRPITTNSQVKSGIS